MLAKTIFKTAHEVNQTIFRIRSVWKSGFLINEGQMNFFLKGKGHFVHRATSACRSSVSVWWVRCSVLLMWWGQGPGPGLWSQPPTPRTAPATAPTRRRSCINSQLLFYLCTTPLLQQTNHLIPISQAPQHTTSTHAQASVSNLHGAVPYQATTS
jgi:hypothetical protein